MLIVGIMIFLFIFLIFVYVVIAIFFPEWVGITGKKAHSIIQQQSNDSLKASHPQDEALSQKINNPTQSQKE